MDADQPIGEIRLQLGEGSVPAEAGVVDEQVDAVAGVEPFLDGQQLAGVGEIGRQHLGRHARRVLELVGESLEALAAPRDQDNIVAVVGEAVGERRPYAGRGARHEGNATIRVHVSLLDVLSAPWRPCVTRVYPVRVRSAGSAGENAAAHSCTSCASCGGVTPRLTRRRETFCGTSCRKHSS